MNIETLVGRLQQRVVVAQCPLDQVTDLDKAQDTLLDVLDSISQANPYYCKTVAKALIGELEKRGCEVHEGLYERLAEWLPVQALGPTEPDVVEYPLGPGTCVSIKECPSLISGLGTTGLRTWEGALFLASELLQNKHYQESLVDHTVLELGCGTGLLGISLLLNPKVTKVYLTDGDSQLLDTLGANMALNGIAAADPRVDVRSLWWGRDQIPLDVTTLVAADVTYDASIIPSLVDTVHEAMARGNVQDLILSATVRNETTLAAWETALQNGSELWTWEVVVTRSSGAQSTGPLYYPPGTAAIKIYHVRKL